MASHSLPVALHHTNHQRNKSIARTRTLPFVVAALIALLILFSWLRLIQALEIADTGRKIQVRTEELQRIERVNNEFKIKIAETQAPARLAKAAADLGFGRSKPVYIPFPEPLAGTTEDGRGGQVSAVVPAGRDGWTEDEQTLWDFATSELNTLLEVEATP